MLPSLLLLCPLRPWVLWDKKPTMVPHSWYRVSAIMASSDTDTAQKSLWNIFHGRSNQWLMDLMQNEVLPITPFFLPRQLHISSIFL